MDVDVDLVGGQRQKQDDTRFVAVQKLLVCADDGIIDRFIAHDASIDECVHASGFRRRVIGRAVEPFDDDIVEDGVLDGIEMRVEVAPEHGQGAFV